MIAHPTRVLSQMRAFVSNVAWRIAMAPAFEPSAATQGAFALQPVASQGKPEADEERRTFETAAPLGTNAVDFRIKEKIVDLYKRQPQSCAHRTTSAS